MTSPRAAVLLDELELHVVPVLPGDGAHIQRSMSSTPGGGPSDRDDAMETVLEMSVIPHLYARVKIPDPDGNAIALADPATGG